MKRATARGEFHRPFACAVDLCFANLLVDPVADLPRFVVIEQRTPMTSGNHPQAAVFNRRGRRALPNR